MVDLAMPMTDLEISRKPYSTIYDTSKFRKKRKTGQENEERMVSPLTDFEMFRKPYSTMDDTSKFRKK